jgi:CBS domain containing-hemolysin-like protein
MDLLSLFSFRKYQEELPENSHPAYEDFLDRLSELETVRAKDIMTPRALVKALDVDVEIPRIHLSKTGHTNYLPVYKGDLDHVAGWIGREKLNDLFHSGYPGNLTDHYLPARSINEDLSLDKVFFKFVQTSAPLMVVQNTLGTTVGILYLSEVLKVFFGFEIDSESQVTSGSATFSTRSSIARS